MPDPTVCAILLTRDRPEYARRAVECFTAQTYPEGRRSLYVYDSGITPCTDALSDRYPDLRIRYHRTLPDGRTIGRLRNEAIAWQADIEPDIIMHLDDDDYSHPNRMSEQVALLQASGADAVGYREVLFAQHFKADRTLFCEGPQEDRGKEYRAYLYTNNDSRYVIGSSLCYWRKAWAARPFEDVAREEDGRWIKGVKCVGVPSIPHNDSILGSPQYFDKDPRMICRIHAGNANHYPIDELVGASPNWKRAPEWDAHCRSILE